MNEISIINKSTLLGREINIYGTPDEPMFLAKDVAEWIEHTQPSKMVDNIDEYEKLMEQYSSQVRNAKPGSSPKTDSTKS